MTRLTTYHERLGQYEPARHYARRQLELEPWREEAHRQLMRLLVLSGERTSQGLPLPEVSPAATVSGEEIEAYPAQVVLRRLSVFHGGFRRRTAAAVAEATIAPNNTMKRRSPSAGNWATGRWLPPCSPTWATWPTLRETMPAPRSSIAAQQTRRVQALLDGRA